MSSKKMTLLTFGSQTFTGEIKSKGSGVGFGTDVFGNPLVSMKIPGYSGNGGVDAMTFRPENMAPFTAALRGAVKGTGPDPLQIAQDTMSRDTEGNVSFRLSYAARSRTITLPPAEAEEFADFMDLVLGAVEAKIAEDGEEDGEEDGAEDGEE